MAGETPEAVKSTAGPIGVNGDHDSRNRLAASRVWLTLFLCLVVASSSVEKVLAVDELVVTPNFNVAQPIKDDTPISFNLSRELRNTDGRIAIVVGPTDVTSLFVVSGARFTYLPGLLKLPVGNA